MKSTCVEKSEQGQERALFRQKGKDIFYVYANQASMRI